MCACLGAGCGGARDSMVVLCALRARCTALLLARLRRAGCLDGGCGIDGGRLRSVGHASIVAVARRRAEVGVAEGGRRGGL
jgi:hypothetical protein